MIIVPRIDNHAVSGLLDLAAIGIVFPAMVLGAAQCHDDESEAALSSLSSDVFYPMYCIHYPLVRVIATVIRHFNLGVGASMALSLACTAAIAAGSSIIFRYYDQPVRAWLGRRFPATKR